MSKTYTYPLPAGFQAFYDQAIWPKLKVGDESRVDAIRAYALWLIGLLIFGVAVVWVWQELSVPFNRWTGTPALTIYLFMFASVHTKYIKSTRNNLKDTLVKPAFAFFGWEYSRTVYPRPDTQTLAELSLLPKHGTATFEDCVKGRIHNTDFEMTEVKCRNSSNGYFNKMPFQGLILAIEHPQKFSGNTIVLRKHRRVSLKIGIKKVGLVDPVFRERFQAYGTDQVETRYLLTPDVMFRLVQLESAVHGKNMQFAFTDGLMWVTIETNDRYEGGSLFSSLTEASRVHELLNEVYALHDLVNGLKKPQSPESFNT